MNKYQKISIGNFLFITRLIIGLMAGSVTLSALSQDVFLRNTESLNHIVEQCSLDFQKNRVEVQALHNFTQAPISKRLRDGRLCHMVKVVDGHPIYYAVDNLGAADSISTDEVVFGGSFGLSLNGSGVLFGIWDEESVRSSHIELAGRVQNEDIGAFSNHATHVAGTLIASGLSSVSKGMSPAATLHSFNYADDATEMAQGQLQNPPIAISNHSYSLLSGWVFDFLEDGRWVWFGDESLDPDEDWKFGFYDDASRIWDNIAFNSPNYLIVKSAGNDRDDVGPFPSDSHWRWNGVRGGFTLSIVNRSKDGGDSGYDSISGGAGNAKNVLTVGAVNAVFGGYSSVFDGGVTNFSGWGPTDDGRIKPDVVAQGVDVHSTNATSDFAYSVMTGTSMATPAIAGSLGLLVQLNNNLSQTPLLSSTLRGLAIHSADELGLLDGPDYRNGWGLFNTATAASIIIANANATFVDHITEFTLNNDTTYTSTFQSDGLEPIKMTLAWTDRLGPIIGKQVDPLDLALINDLDLRVVGPEGEIHLPWVLNPVSPQAGAQRGDNFRDNVEQIVVKNPVPGVYSLQVSHKSSLVGGSQRASLIVTGNIDQSAEPAPPVFVSSPDLSAMVGFDYQYSADNKVRAIGSQPIAISLLVAPEGMSLVEGSIEWTPQSGQEGDQLVELLAVNHLGSEIQRFVIHVEQEVVNFFAVDHGEYGNQDVSGEVNVEAEGTALHLIGNRVRQIPFDYTVTPNTRLSFEFSSSRRGEVHAIGLDDDLFLNVDRTFQLYGTQTYGVQDFRTYPGDGSTVVYDIPIGQYITGVMRHLFFVMDHDINNPNGESVFSRVRVYEHVEQVAPDITSTPVTTVSVGDNYQYSLVASGSGSIDFTLTTAPAGMQLINGVVNWSPSSGQVGTHTVSVTASNALGSDLQTFNVTVATENNTINLNGLTFGQYGNQDGVGTATVESNGAALRLVGNRVRQMPFDYTVTPNTRLSFEFSSSRRGEVHAIGLDDDLFLNVDRTFQLYGTQTYGVQDFRTYPGDGSTVVYDIPIGQYITGAMRHLFFVMDHDVVNANGESVFGRIWVYEN